MAETDNESDPVASIESLLRWVRIVAWCGVAAFLAVILAVLAVRQESIDRADAIVRTRNDSRVATCQVLDKMFMAHNDFVQTAVAERQAIIDGAARSQATDEQKQENAAFFGQQIANYQRDLIPIVNCNDPAQVAALFTPTGG